MARTSEYARLTVCQRYAQDRPKPGQYEEWAERVAEALEIPITHVRRYVAQEQELYQQAIRHQTLTVAQQVANFVGASQIEAFMVLREGLSASRKKIVKDHRGTPQKDEQGNLIYEEVPIWPTRTESAKVLLQIHGSFAPQVIEVNKTVHHIGDMSEEQLQNELELTHAALGRMLNDAAATRGKKPGTSGGNEGQASDQRSLVLVDGVYQDAGRAGPAESIQTVPQERVPSANAAGD